MRQMTLLQLLLLLTASLQGCSGDEPNLNCEGTLYDKPLKHIQHCVEGEWQHHKTRGGFTGNLEYTYTNSTMTLTRDSHIWIIDGDTFIKSGIRYSKEENTQGNLTFLLKGSSEPSFSFEMGVIQSDTLYWGDVGPDGFGYLFTRID
jgi:hypothetical protein